MATTEIVILSDSLDERIKNGVETVEFFNPLTGEELEIELGEANRKHFSSHLEKLSKYIDAARKVEVKPAKKTVGKADSEVAKIREWAIKNGYTVGDRGRIAAEIKAAYAVAMVSSPAEVDAEPVSEAAASVALDGETQVVDEPTVAEVESDVDELDLSDEGILKLMSELDAAGEPVTLDDLKAAVDSESK